MAPVNILLIETSTGTCSVSLSRNGQVLASRDSNQGNDHASVLARLIQELIAHTVKDIHSLGAVAVSKGPGSYTGLRIGVSTAKGLCYGLGIPLLSIDTLQSMVAGYINSHAGYIGDNERDTWFCPLLDARRMEVYMAYYDARLGEKKATSAEIIDEHYFLSVLDERKVVFMGNAVAKVKTLVHSSNAVFVDDFIMTASNLATLAFRQYQEKQFENIAYFEPFYLKNFVTTIPRRKVLLD